MLCLHLHGADFILTGMKHVPFFSESPSANTRVMRCGLAVLLSALCLPACTAGDGEGVSDGLSATTGVWAQGSYIKASNPGVRDAFGETTALSEDGLTLVIGAPYERSKATGINGVQADETAQNSGAVYVFRRATVGGAWAQSAYLKASNAEQGDRFGASVAVSADGSTVAVGAGLESSSARGLNGDQSNNLAGVSGAVYVFARAGTVWSQEAYVKASNTEASDWFGDAVALSGDGTTLAVGAFAEASVATGVNGDQQSNAAWRAGAVYVFKRADSKWAQEAYLKASNAHESDRFGGTLALSSDGAMLAVGAEGEDSSARGVGGPQRNTGDDDYSASGAVYMFQRSGSNWSQQAYIKASNTGASDLFGSALALSADGKTLAVGAAQEDSGSNEINVGDGNNGSPQSGAVYVFKRTATTWAQDAYVKASNAEEDDRFGTSVALSGDGSVLAVGANWEWSSARGINGSQTDNAAASAGAVYVFQRSATQWTQNAYVKASNTQQDDRFGTSVALSVDGKTLVASAAFEDSSATGVGGDQLSDAMANSGAVYVFQR